MRILFGKFHSHETTHTSNKDTKANKRSTIIQFLSSCNEYELNYFFNLIFDCVNVALQSPLENQSGDRFEINDNSLSVAQFNTRLASIQCQLNDRSHFDLTKAIPLKKILGILQSIEIIMKKLARQMEIFSHRILLMLGYIHKYAAIVYELASNKIPDYQINLLKIIRQQVTLRFKQFFECFDHLNFSQNEYLFVMDSFIWPQITRVPSESLKSVSNILKIFSSWSERPLYYPLFAIKLGNFESVEQSLIQSLTHLYPDFKSKNILDILFELADAPKCGQNVVDYVLEIVHNLVSMADYKKDFSEDSEAKADPLPFDLTQIASDQELSMFYYYCYYKYFSLIKIICLI